MFISIQVNKKYTTYKNMEKVAQEDGSIWKDEKRWGHSFPKPLNIT